MCPLAKGGFGVKRQSDYKFVHTDDHQEFMELLLDKRRALDEVITAKETARRELAAKKPQPAINGPAKRNGGGRGKYSGLVQDKENVFQTQGEQLVEGDMLAQLQTFPSIVVSRCYPKDGWVKKIKWFKNNLWFDFHYIKDKFNSKGWL